LIKDPEQLFALFVVASLVLPV